MSIHSLQRFVYNLQNFNECFYNTSLLTFVIDIYVLIHALKLPAKCFLLKMMNDAAKNDEFTFLAAHVSYQYYTN